METIVSMMECPVCWETMTSVIKQCRDGHSFCQKCAKQVRRCPLCTAPITSTRNYQLEGLIANLKDMKLQQPDSCRYAKRGCQVKNEDILDLKDHEFECKKRDYACEGKLFAGWQCDWTGTYDELYQHFQDQHMSNKITLIEFELPVHMKIPLGRDFFDVQIVQYKKKKQLFWYKCKVDPWREKAYWLIQFIGTKSEANKYFYQFTMENEPPRVLKAREVCESGNCDAKVLFDCGKCVTMPFSTLRNYLNHNDDILFTFTIGDVDDCKITKPKESDVKGPAKGVAQTTQAQSQAIVSSISSRNTINQVSSFFLQYPPISFYSRHEFNTLWGPQSPLMPPVPYRPPYIPYPSFRSFGNAGSRQRYCSK